MMLPPGAEEVAPLSARLRPGELRNGFSSHRVSIESRRQAAVAVRRHSHEECSADQPAACKISSAPRDMHTPKRAVSGGGTEMSEVLRERIDAMRRELRHEATRERAARASKEGDAPAAAAPHSHKPSKEGSGVSRGVPSASGTRSVRPSKEGAQPGGASRRPSAETNAPAAAPSTLRGGLSHPTAAAAAAATPRPGTATPRRTPRVPPPPSMAHTPSVDACDASSSAPDAVPPPPLTPRKKVISPPTADEAREMEIFRQVETARKHRQQQRATGAGELPTVEAYATAAKLDVDDRARGGGRGDTTARELRTEVPSGNGKRSRSSARHDAFGRRERRSPQARRTGNGERRSKSAGGGAQRASRRDSASGKAYQKKRPSQQTGAQSEAPAAAAVGGVAGLKQRAAQQEALMAERAATRDAANRLLTTWHAQHKGDVYRMMKTCHVFGDIFGGVDPIANMSFGMNDATGLKKAWHKLAAKLHPDRQQHAPTATQVLAEEVFKTLTLAYNKEVERLALRA